MCSVSAVSMGFASHRETKIFRVAALLQSQSRRVGTTKIVEKVTDTQQLRKELQEVKKLARERAKAITIRIPQLKDCKNHFDKTKGKGKGTMVFLCEGRSRPVGTPSRVAAT